MKKLTFIIILAQISFVAVAQTNVSVDSVPKKVPNPIIFATASVGVSRGFMGGLDLNYQFAHQLLTVRWTEILNTDLRLFISPSLRKNTTTESEFALMYGYRKVFGGSSLSFSSGISHNSTHITHGVTRETILSTQYIGVPFEIRFDLFNKIKQRYRIFYGLIPVGKPTALSRSVGIKLVGNASKRSYFGVGLNLGLGYFKVYKE